MAHIKIIIGSMRPGRFGNKPAKWIHELTKEYTDNTFELIDLKEVNLPLLDESIPPIAGQYEHEHTKQWAAKIKEADGFIFITPEYNHGAPASLKNAIDFAGQEWAHKPAAFVSYGADAGGARAVEHLRLNLIQLAAFPIKDQVTIVNYFTLIDENGEFMPTKGQEETAKKMLAEISFWSNELAVIRAKKS